MKSNLKNIFLQGTNLKIGCLRKRQENCRFKIESFAPEIRLAPDKREEKEMLDQLVESREGYGDGARRGGFLLTTMMLVVTVFASGMMWSLFAKDLGIGDESLELSSLVAPVITDVEPPKPEPIVKEPKHEESLKEESAVPIRNNNITRIDESPIVPTSISIQPNKGKERPIGTFIIGEGVETDANYSSSSGNNRGRGNTSGTGIGGSISPNAVEDEKDEPPVIKKAAPEPTPVPQKPTVQSLGVINGKATSLPKPPYPPAARAVRAQGDVSVQVMIDETGRVVSAKAVSGHPLLKNAAEDAAQNARFAPTLLSNQPVKVTGVIIYKFLAQ